MSSDPDKLSEDQYDATFDGVDWRGRVIEGREFHDCTFVNVQLADGVFRNCKLIGCTFDRCDLSNLKLRGTSVRDFTAKDAKMIGIAWTDVAGLGRLTLTGCTLNYSSFEGLDLRKATLVKCVAREVDFSRANLGEASLRGSDLSGARFQKTNLAKADLRDATRYAIDPRDCIVTRAKFALPDALALLAAFDIALE